MNDSSHRAYWSANLALIARCLSLWFFASFGGGILFRDALDAFTVLGVPAGFWFAQQGAIWVFLGVLAYYGWASHRLDQKFDVDDG
ncbi:MAG: DUF4212 domain-containing protein [Pseudomonadota bacterium]|jgi:putative solute:sodium symporter small subunit|nr:DUF4212 domain-containing protein [Pseudomonadota bacterium]MED5444267.1 DUF4212 domain-containing protein [Pseudomonadota bacterium]MEE3110330.1 DUF4212 domain-containing protein [Pseudomonadota bacterium]